MKHQSRRFERPGVSARRRGARTLAGALVLIASFAIDGLALARVGDRPGAGDRVAPGDPARVATASAAVRGDAGGEPAPASAVRERKADVAGAPATLRYGNALPPPPTGQWQFRVYYGDYTEGGEVASLDYAIEREGERYRVLIEGRATGFTSLLYSGLLTQSSAGRVGANGLVPERYAERRGSRAAREVSIDYPSRQVAFTGKPPVALREGTQDRLSALVQLGLIARAAPERFAPGATIEIVEASGSGVESVNYRSIGASVLETDDGSIRALHIERLQPRGAGQSRVEVWLGYDRSLIPVRIRLTDAGGRVLDQLIAN